MTALRKALRSVLTGGLLVWGRDPVEQRASFSGEKRALRNKNPPAMRVRIDCYAKITFPSTIKLFRLNCRKER